MGGTIAKHSAQGDAVGLCDLTAGEMGSNGTPDERIAEAEAAAGVLGARWRVNLRLADRAIGSGAGDMTAAVQLIRRARPRTIAIPYWQDRHPDHVRASQFLTEAIFSAGLRRFPVEGEAWKPEWVCHYFINDHHAPSFVVDVTESYEKKRQALACHRTQFNPVGGTGVATRLTSHRFRQLIESRDACFGADVDADFAEGFIVKQPILRLGLLRRSP
jgi:bacillithiol biosynthesis deacetylase BshB1